MAVTRSLGDETTVTARGVPNPDSQYSYAVVLSFAGALTPLARWSAEAAARDVLSALRAVSWIRTDDGAVRIQFTRADSGSAARVTGELLSELESAFADARERYDDEAFDRELSALAGE